MQKILYSLILLFAVFTAQSQTPAIIFTTTTPVGSNFSFGIDATIESCKIQVDWGDGLLKDYIITYSGSSVSGTLVGPTVKIYGLDIYNLAVSSKNITALNVSAVQDLRYLDCSKNQLITLDVSKNGAITDLTCNENQLTALDVSNNLGLEFLTCSKNQLTAIDVSSNHQLLSFLCESNQLTALDLSKNNELGVLICDKNMLTSIDVSNSISLNLLTCSGNQLTTLDVSKNTALTNLSCWKNQLSVLDVSKNTALSIFYCSQNALTNLDVSTNTALTLLHCANNKLSNLDVTKNSLLGNLICNGNQFMFSTLPVQQSSWSSYSYSPQQSVMLSKKQYEASEKLDLSNQLAVNGSPTIYAWVKKSGSILNVGEDYSANNGVFTFLKAQPDSIYCRMTNASFPALTLNTTNAKIVASTSTVDETNMHVRVYPNPVKDVMHVELGSNISRVEVFTIEGLKVFELVGNNTNEVNISAANLPKGMLILKVYGTNTVMETKVLNE